MNKQQIKLLLGMISMIDEVFNEVPLDTVVQTIRDRVYRKLFFISLMITNEDKGSNVNYFRELRSNPEIVEFIQWAIDNYESDMEISDMWHPIVRMSLILLDTNEGQSLVKSWIRIFSSEKLPA